MRAVVSAILASGSLWLSLSCASHLAGNGLFTSTNPELRRVIPEDKGSRVKVKVVYVVLEAQYQSALTQAVKKINTGSDKVCFELVGYLLEEMRDPTNYEAFQKDLADANIFIGSLIFIEELAEKVRMRQHVHPAASAALMKET